MDLADQYGEDHISYEGHYVIPPRLDFRVSLEGFTAIRLPENVVLEMTKKYRDSAGVIECGKIRNGLHTVRFWWD